MNVLELVDELKVKYVLKDEFDFFILVEKSPILKQSENYCCKILAVIIAGITKILSDTFKDNIESVIVKLIPRRNINISSKRYPVKVGDMRCKSQTIVLSGNIVSENGNVEIL